MFKNNHPPDASLNISKIQLFGESGLKETDLVNSRLIHLQCVNKSTYSHWPQKILKIAQLYLHFTLHGLMIFYEMTPTLLTFAFLWWFILIFVYRLNQYIICQTPSSPHGDLKLIFQQLNNLFMVFWCWMMVTWQANDLYFMQYFYDLAFHQYISLPQWK